MTDNPWLKIPAADYEGHMRDVGQSSALRAIFAAVYAEYRPKRLAVLGCTMGHDLTELDPEATRSAVGVDINPDYLEIARQRVGSRVELVHGDVLHAPLPGPAFDLVHAALLLEYVEPVALFRRIHGMLVPEGICSLVTQEPATDVEPVTRTAYASLQILDGHMSLRTAEEVAALAEGARLHRISQRPVQLASGKTLVSSIFTKTG